MSEEKKGIKEALELIDGLKEIAIILKGMFKDGKIGMEDLAQLPKLMEKQEILVQAFSGLSDLDEEIKDIALEEAVQVLLKLGEAAKAYKEA